MLRERIRDQEFELACLVTAAGQGHQVIAFYPNVGTAEVLAEPAKGLYRRGRMQVAATSKASELHRRAYRLLVELVESTDDWYINQTELRTGSCFRGATAITLDANLA